MLRAFLSYPYRPETEIFADAVRSFLAPLQIEAVDGKWPDASIALQEDMIARIVDCQILISLQFEDIPSPWADHEIGFAVGAGLDVILITNGSVPRSGLIAEQFHISRSKGDLFVCTSLAHTLNYIKQRRAVELVQALSTNAPIGELESEAWSPDILSLLYRFRALFARSQFQTIVNEASLASEQFPECWRFLVVHSSAYTHLHMLDQADKLLEDTIERFPDRPRALSYAYDNKGWVISRRPGGEDSANVKERLRFHRRALGYEARVVTYFDIIFCLLKLGEIQEADREVINCLEQFPESLNAFKNRVKLEGKEFVQAVAKSDLLSALLFPRQEQTKTERRNGKNERHDRRDVASHSGGRQPWY